jgi:polyisoprenyl-phosphate glycosyltransferase
VLVIDADFQDPLEMIAPMVAHWRDGVDVVYAVRDRRSDEPLLKRLGAPVFYALLEQGSRVTIPRDARDFRVMDRRVVAALNQLPERSRMMKGLFAWVGFKSLAVPMTVQPRAGGESAFRLRQLRRLAMTGVTEFSNTPLKLAGAIGFLIALGAFAWGGWIVFERIFLGSPLPGFATLAASIMFFSGIQLVFIGIIGEYLGRVYDEVKGRPSYILADRTDHSPLGNNGSDGSDS